MSYSRLILPYLHRSWSEWAFCLDSCMQPTPSVRLNHLSSTTRWIILGNEWTWNRYYRRKRSHEFIYGFYESVAWNVDCDRAIDRRIQSDRDEWSARPHDLILQLAYVMHNLTCFTCFALIYKKQIDSFNSRKIPRHIFVYVICFMMC